MPVTEFNIIPVKGGVEDWKEQLKLLLQTLKKQDGYLRTRWGPCNENMQRLVLSIGWENVEASNAWKASSDYATVMATMKTVLQGEISSRFFCFVPFAPKVIDAAIVEVLTYHNCTDVRASLAASLMMDFSSWR
ncbi:uncharacterized protein HRG_04647 [Hirsutella rhossiliensis]|uniref:ABM domain-containing protein n=1 Tax=Hirsutella rhossiliensis TaxID=111463 RepID=A0A9P8SJH7_9HYPO|nr:uncharacterized protein HRG_04647 [Hirsutella rhossiliensis]KAH0964219.1 hypothetical protein HRG_04647 [Hirsutella rhossiliensis]